MSTRPSYFTSVYARLLALRSVYLHERAALGCVGWRRSASGWGAQHALRRRVDEPVRRRDRLAGELALVHVEAGAKVGIVLERLHPALVGERERERQGRVVKGEGRGAGDGARHVGDAIMDDAVDDIGRMGVRRRLRGLAAAALINGDVDDDRARAHG